MNGQEDKRYIKLRYEDNKGFWYGEFSGEWVTRQVSIRGNEISVGGRDTKMAEHPLSQIEKESKRHLFKKIFFEITAEEFEEIWQKYVEEPGADAS